MHALRQKHRVPLADRFSLSPEEASAITGIGLTSVREAINEGKLNAKRHGRRIILLPDEIKAWLKSLPDASADRGQS